MRSCALSRRSDGSSPIDHYYYQWDSSFPNSAQTWTVGQNRIPFINWKAGGAWSAIANGSQDATIIARAEAIKSFGYPIYLTFHHEPENDLGTYGTPKSSRRRSATSSTCSAAGTSRTSRGYGR